MKIDKRVWHVNHKGVMFIGLLGLAANQFLNGDQSAYAQPRSLLVRVMDSENKSITAAEVAVVKWTGVLTPTEFEGVTDNSGTIQFKDFEHSGYSYVIVKHPDYAPAIETFTPTGSEQFTVEVKMAPPISNFVQVVKPDGQPLMGAEVTRLEFSSQLTESKTFLNQDFFRAISGTDGDRCR